MKNRLPPGAFIIKITPQMRTPEAIREMKRDIMKHQRELGVKASWRDPKLDEQGK